MEWKYFTLNEVINIQISSKKYINIWSCNMISKTETQTEMDYLRLSARMSRMDMIRNETKSKGRFVPMLN
jgi:hypothetical protein